MRYGYVRSYRDSMDAEETQRARLQHYGVDPANVIIEEPCIVPISPAALPRLQELVRKLGPRDELVVTRLDRCGRDVLGLMDLGEALKRVGARWTVLDHPVNFSSHFDAMLFQSICTLAAYELDVAREAADGRAL